MATRNYTLWVKDASGGHVEWTIPDAVVEGLRVEYRDLNLRAQLLRMHTWTVRNPSRRWYEASAMRGVVRWLNRARAAKDKPVSPGQRRLDMTAAPPPDAGPGVPPPPGVAEMLKLLRAAGSVG